jgi:hypothetical protein
MSGAWLAARSPVERVLIPEVDPRRDLSHRGDAWGFSFQSAALGELSRFAGSLAVVEAEAWEGHDASLATRAYSDRRFLFADRIIPWAVPWLRAVASKYPEALVAASTSADELLRLGEHHRPAPDLVSGEGIHLPGYDGFGPRHEPEGTRARVASLWGGLVQLDVDAVLGRPLHTLVARYTAAAMEWQDLAAAHPGSAGCWRDLAVRARQTAALLAGDDRNSRPDTDP